jgi:hypothetical protein
VPLRLRIARREKIRMGIDGTAPFAAKPDPRLSRCCSGRAGSTQHSPMAKASRLPHFPDPYVNLSIHTAPDVRPFPWQSRQWAKSQREEVAAPISCG